jgi:HlyD family type I secretion membrane fusion protein
MTTPLLPAPETAKPVASGSPALETCDRTLRHALRASWITIFVTFGLIGGWLAVARLDSAVVTQGVVENANTTRQIQHLEGGIVREFFVRNGDRVKAGDLLLRLDPTQSAASADLFSAQLLGNRARQERLEAEIATAPDLAFSAPLSEQAKADPVLARAMDSEARHFALQRKELLQARDLLQTNIAQSEAEIQANEVRRGIAVREAEFVRKDLEAQRALRDKQLTSQARVSELEQASLALEEKVAQSDIDIARIRQAILGFRLQIAQVDQEYRRRAAEQLEDVTREIRALERDAIIANDSLNRVEIRAPVDGTVQESILGTVGAVIRGGDTILKIAPSEDEYIIAARVSPNDIDGILPGAAALITFPAFQSLDLSPADGELLTLSRDRIVDPYTRTDYYEARIRLDETTLPKAQVERLVAGMSATAVLPTGKRTALNYLLGPLMRRLQSAMREE